jgi:L-ascorbate metabolism protein UlaG (beta-lactamase superfamily)
MKKLYKIVCITAIFAVVGCAAFLSQSKNVNYDASKKHHTPEGFKNNYPHEANQSFWKWQWERATKNTVAKAPEGGWQSVLPSVKPDVEFLKKNRSERTMTWLGHATVLLQTNGVNIITDPVFSERTAPVQFAGPKREVPFMMVPDELPLIDVVLISHNHYDHLDVGTIEDFKTRFPGARYLVPLGLKAWFDELGVANVREMDWWDAIDIGELKFTFTPAQHWSKRSLVDTNRSLWGGFVVEARGSTSSPRTVVSVSAAASPALDAGSPRTVVSVSAATSPELDAGSPRTVVSVSAAASPALDAGSPPTAVSVSAAASPVGGGELVEPWRFIYTGDTGYSQDFKDIGAKFPSGFDWAAIPIGAYEPRWFMKAQHTNPDESVQIMKDLGAKRAIAVHWGTWMLTDEALDLPPKHLAEALKKYSVEPSRFAVFKNGETRKL